MHVSVLERIPISKLGIILIANMKNSTIRKREFLITCVHFVYHHSSLFNSSGLNSHMQYLSVMCVALNGITELNYVKNVFLGLYKFLFVILYN